MKKLFVSLFFALLGAITSSAQTATITPSPTTYGATAGTITFTVNLSYSGTVTALGLSIGTVPTGWTYGTTAGTNVPETKPGAGVSGPYFFSYSTIPTTKTPSFTFTLNYPAGLTGDQTLGSINLNLTPSGGSPASVTVSDVVIPQGVSSGGGGGGGTTPAPTISIQPVNLTVNQGQTAAFGVAVSSSSAVTYQWRKNGFEIFGATASTYGILSVNLTDGGTYDVVVTNAGGSVTSTGVTLTVNIPPSVTSQPTNVTVNQGQTATFSVGATATPNPTYQWRKNGVNISGATSSLLTLTGVTAADATSYDVVVTNAGGSVTSSAATLTVVLLPTVATPPASTSVTAGGTANFSVTAGGTGPFTYQWRKNGSGLSGQNAATLSLVGVTTADTGNYDVVISNAIGNVVSPYATLSVNTLPGIITPPFDVTATAGQQVQFFVVVSGGSVPAFQWRKNTGGGPVNITNANNAVLLLNGVTTAVFTLSNVGAGDVANYDVVVTNSIGSTTSPVAALALVTYPSITTQPASQSATAGGNVSFSVTATGTAPLYYQWRKNGAAIAGATGATLNLLNVTTTDAANYDCVVTNGYGTATSSVAALSATLNVLPTVTTQPIAQSVNAGGTASFSVVATGTPAPTYQWRKNGVPFSPNASATTATLTLSNLQSSDIGSYDCIVSNSVGAILSSAAALSVNLPPVIVFQPSTYTALSGLNAYFVVTMAGTGPFTYVWRKNGVSLAGVGNVNVQNGTNTSLLTVFSTSAADAGTYDVVVTTGLGTATSNGSSALFVVSSTFSPTISNPPISQTATEGTSVTFSVIATGNPAPTYQWNKNGVALTDGTNPSGFGIISGATTANLNISQATLPDAASYNVTATNTGGSATSSPATLTINKVPVFGTQPVGTTIVAGASYTLTSAATANPSAAFQWFKDGLLLSGATNSSLALTAVTVANAGNYTVVATNSVGSATSTAAAIVVTAAPVITLQPSSASVAQNQSVTLSVAATGGPAPTYQWNKGGVPIGGATGATFTLSGAQSTDAGNYTVDVINATSTVTSAIAVVTVTALPIITVQPVGGSFNQGQSTTLSVTATGGVPLTYQWFKDGVAVSGAKSASLALPSLVSDNAGLYTVVVTNPVGTVTGGGAFVQVSAMPSITTQPSSQAVIVGNSASFTVTATGNPGPSYQWSKNGVNIDGAVFSTLTFNTTQKSDAGLYRVSVSNSLGTTFSGIASLTVNDIPQVAPAITTQPVGYTGFSGTGTTLTVVATGTPVPTYQWRKDGTAISGATNSSLALTGVVTESGAYTVVVTNAVGSVTSSAATVLIKPAIPLPVIVVQPISRTLQPGASATLSVQATGQGPLTYQWRKDGTAISGATSTELALTSVTSANAGVYTVTITNEGGTTTSANATVTVTSANVAPTILSQPSPQVALVGGSATFTVVASGNPTPAYQWRKNGVNLAGATSASLTLSNVQTTDAAGYDVVLLNSAGQTISALARLTVATAATVPVITRQPADVRVVAGRSATFAVTANGTPTPTYQWRLNGTNVSGATSATLSLSGVTTAQAGAYSVVVTNSAGSVTSNNATLTVLARSFAGTWIGTLGTGGSFALRVNDDNTGVFLGFIGSSKTSYVGRDVKINDDGSFRIVVTTTASVAASLNTATADGTTAAATDDLAFAGNIASDSALTGASTSGSTLSLTAARSNDSGITAAVAGFYQASASGSSAQTLIIVSPAGQALVLIQSGATVDGGTGTADATGRVTVTTAGAQSVVANVVAETGAVSATVVDSKNVTTSFAGYAAGSAGLGGQRLVNISTRASAGVNEQAVIVGFVITGLESKTVLVRAVGPTLRSSFGLTTALTAPRLDLQRGTTVLATNTNWTTSSNTAEIAAAAVLSGAFPLGATSADSVILTTLAPGNYTATCSASNGVVGIGLVEVYDLSGGSTAQKLANISTRAIAGAGENVLTAGVVVAGSAPKRVLIRAAGPVLAQFGLSSVLARPVLTLFSGTTSVASNTGWSTSADAASISEAGLRVGAFAFPAGSLDAALLLNLAPGNYTAQVSGVGGTTGLALVEIYELP